MQPNSFLLLLLVLSFEIHPCLKILSSHHFFASTPRLHMNMMNNITRVIWQSMTAPIVSPLSHMSTRAPRTGTLIFLILPWIGLISASKGFLSPVMSLICFWVPHCPWLLRHLIRVPPLSVRSTFTSNAHLSSFKALPCQFCQQTSSTRDTINKRSLELCASIVDVFLDGCGEWYVSIVFLAGQVEDC